MPIRLDNATVNAYVLQFDDDLLKAALVSTTAASLEGGGNLRFPIESAEELLPVHESIVASVEVDEPLLRRVLLETWPQDTFPIRDSLELARLFLMHIRTWRLEDRVGTIRNDPIECMQFRYPPRG